VPGSACDRKRAVPDRRRLYADMAVLFRQDLANVEAGIYPLPVDHDGTLPDLLARSRLFFEDLPTIHRRRQNRDIREVLSDETRGKRPKYYLQNFHFQSGGWLTSESAQRYDTQVEVLFKARRTRRAGQHWCRSMRSSPGAINAASSCSTSAAAPAVSSTHSSRLGRVCRRWGSICRRPTSPRRDDT
jgi:hypothetical protein